VFFKVLVAYTKKTKHKRNMLSAYTVLHVISLSSHSVTFRLKSSSTFSTCLLHVLHAWYFHFHFISEQGSTYTIYDA